MLISTKPAVLFDVFPAMAVPAIANVHVFVRGNRSITAMLAPQGSLSGGRAAQVSQRFGGVARRVRSIERIDDQRPERIRS